MTLSSQTAAYLAVVAGESQSNPSLAYTVSNTGGGDWAIGWIQQDFRTNGSNSATTLSQALSQSGAFSVAAANAIAQVFQNNPTASAATINSLLSNVAGTSTSISAINNVLLNNAAAQNAITSGSESDFNSQWAYVLNMIQSPSATESFQQALDDPTVGPALEILLSNYNNQIGMQSSGNLYQLITTGTASFGGTTMSLSNVDSPNEVYNTIANAIYNKAEYNNNPMQGANRIGDSINASDYYDSQNGIATLGTVSLSNSKDAITFTPAGGSSLINDPGTILPEIVVTLPNPTVGPVDTSIINIDAIPSDVTLTTPDFSDVLPSAQPNIAVELSEGSSGTVNVSNASVFIGQGSDVTVDGDDDYIDTYDDSQAYVDGSSDDITLSSYQGGDPPGGYDGDIPLEADGLPVASDFSGTEDVGDGDEVTSSNEPADPPPSGVAKLPPGNGKNGGLGLSKAPNISNNSVASLPNVFAGSETEEAAQSALVQAESVLSANGVPALEAAQFEGATWSGGVITWSLASGPDSIGAQLTGVIGAQYSSLIQSAFQTWAAASGLKFVEVSDSSSTDIRLGWSNFNSESTGIVGYTGFDTQNSSFTPGVTISLENPAETPLVTDANGQLAYSGTETEFTQLLLHEIGHALGLADNADPNSIMYPILSGTNETLDATDIAGIQALYQPSTISATTASDTAAVTTGLTDIASLASSSPTTVASSLMSSLTSSALSPFAIEADQLIGSMAAFAPSISPTTFIPSTFSVNSGLTLAAAGI